MRHTTHTLVIAILVLATAHASGEPFLSAPFLSFDIGGPPSTFLSFPFPPQAWGIATADFNRDGHLDLAVSEPRRSYVSILLGDGRGSFATGGSFSTGGEPRGVLVADLNSDGIPDLITSNYRADAVSVLLGIGDGTFRPATRAPISGGGSAIGTRTADFNNDGHVDIAVASLGSFPGISISLGKGDGSFNFPTQVVHGVRPLSLATGDLNDDGNQDIIYANDEVPDTMFVLLGDGLGSFSERAILATGILTPALHLADVNGDHVLDVLALSSGNTVGSSGVLVFRGEGDGTFAPPDRVSSASTTIGDFMASDVNRDGMVDLIVPDDFTSRLNVLLGNGNGSFEPARPFPTERTPFSVAAGDFNEDGRPDLATANRMPGTVSVLLGNGDGTFGRDDQVPVGSFPFALAAHDLDGDGRPDMACANYGSSTVSVIRSIGGRSFAPRVDVPAPSGPDAVRIADLDGDSYPDLIIAGYDANTLSVWHGDRSGGLTGRVDLPTPPAPNAVAIADLNLDGSPDMTVVGGDGSYACAFVVDGLRRRAGSVNEGGIATYLGSDRGAILTGPTVRTGNFLSSVACSDLNGDHIPDMAFTDGRPGTVSVAFGHGDGSYAPPSIVANLRHAIAVAIADLNRDGIPDLAIGEIDRCLSEQGGVTVLWGQGGGAFLEGDTYPTTGAYDVAIADLDGDGNQDIVSANVMNSVSMFFGNGDGSFRPKMSFGTGQMPVSLAVADFDNDGRLDLGVANLEGNTVSILWNQGARPAPRARAFLVGHDRTLPIAAGPPELCVRLEPVGGSFDGSDVVASSVRLISPGTGSVDHISASTPKRSLETDSDGNGVPEVSACFTREDLASLFSNVRGRKVVSASIEGRLTDGRTFGSELDLILLGRGREARSAIAPNPLQHDGILSVATTAPGRLRVSIFDANGRLERVIADLDAASAGEHSFALDRAGGGRPLPSGIHFYRIESVDGVRTGKLVVAR